MQIGRYISVNIRSRSKRKMIVIGYACAVVFAFILSLTNNNAVEASVSSDKDTNYLMIENSIAQSISDAKTIYPEETAENIRSLFALVNNLVRQKNIDKEIIVQKGDTLISVFTDLGLDRAKANDLFYALKKHYDPKNLRVGQKLHANITVNNSDGKFVRLNSFIIEPTIGQKIVATLNEQSIYEVSDIKQELVKEINSATGEIDGSLSISMQDGGVPNRVVHNFISIFAYGVDFRRDVRKGDKFEIIYENYIDSEGKVVKSGDVLYAALILRNDKIAMYRFKDKNGGTDYYTEKGMALKKTLDKKPLAMRNARISSPFGKRYHPILRRTKIHWGVDYAAPSGTPIFAGGDGVVQVAKYNGSYGNYIKIRHNSEFSTAYGHMKGFAKGIRPGVRVKQGQVIAYVGSTGRSTGPHLHYEVIQNGRRVNPRTIRASTGENLSGTNLANFKKMVTDLHNNYKSMFAKKESNKVAQK
ncbi:MAG: peptidoglycan DD-metalloendopeptidase family protein [Alphaproteobacteria bacterium]|nr:peptidoglycan DD-metalloendopeptidase family protein [Alphaproteobacteria bacterium]